MPDKGNANDKSEIREKKKRRESFILLAASVESESDWTEKKKWQKKLK